MHGHVQDSCVQSISQCLQVCCSSKHTTRKSVCVSYVHFELLVCLCVCVRYCPCTTLTVVHAYLPCSILCYHTIMLSTSVLQFTFDSLAAWNAVYKRQETGTILLCIYNGQLVIGRHGKTLVCLTLLHSLHESTSSRQCVYPVSSCFSSRVSVFFACTKACNKRWSHSYPPHNGTASSALRVYTHHILRFSLVSTTVTI